MQQMESHLSSAGPVSPVMNPGAPVSVLVTLKRWFGSLKNKNTIMYF